MIKKSLNSTPLHYLKYVATAGTSAIAGNTFSLARRLKIYHRLNMGDVMFDAFG